MIHRREESKLTGRQGGRVTRNAREKRIISPCPDFFFFFFFFVGWPHCGLFVRLPASLPAETPDGSPSWRANTQQSSIGAKQNINHRRASISWAAAVGVAASAVAVISWRRQSSQLDTLPKSSSRIMPDHRNESSSSSSFSISRTSTKYLRKRRRAFEYFIQIRLLQANSKHP